MKIVITGMGATCAAGAGVARFLEATDGWRTALVAAPRFVPPGLPRFDVGLAPDDALGGEPADDRALRLALPAALEALRSASIRPGDAPRRVDLFFVGTAFGGLETGLALQRRALNGGDAERPALQAGFHSPATTLATRLHLRAQVASYSSSCSSGLAALLVATERIRRGEARLAVVGAVDALSSFTYAGFHAIGALATGRCAPYDVGSTGLALADGAAFLVVESEESAEARGATPIAEVMGVAATNDAHHLISPHPEGRGLASALEAALQESALPASKLALVVGHGVGTPRGDFAELRALAAVLGGERSMADRVPLTSWKGALGHPLAAAALLSVIRAVGALRQRRAPPIIGLRHPVATFPVRLPKAPEPIAATHAAVLAGGLGGQASAAIVRLIAASPARVAAQSGASGDEAKPARRVAPKPALRTIRDEVVVLGAALLGREGFVAHELDELEALHPAMSLIHLPEEGRLAYLAVKRALRDAGELLPPSQDVALVAGVGLASLAVGARFARPLHEPAGSASGATASPSLFAYAAPSSIPAALSASFGFRGPALTTSSGPFASAQALLDAALLLAEGRARRVVVLGFAPASPELDLCLRAGGFLPPEEASAPAGERSGPIAAALVLGRPGEGGGETAAEPSARVVRLVLRRRKRSSVTAPTAALQLPPHLGAAAIVEVAEASRRLASAGGARVPLRLLDPCTGAALWLEVELARA